LSEFLAEAAVLIQADTRAFRAELASALATVPPQITIPIVATAPAAGLATTTQAVAAAQQQAAAQTAAAAATTTAALGTQATAATAAGAATKKLSATQTQAATVAKAYRATQEAVALASLEVVGAANAEQAAQIKTGRAAAAAAAARDLLTKAELAGLDVEKLLQRQVVQTAVSYGEQAAASTVAAEAATRNAVRQAEVTKGLQAQALAGVGLRGAIIGANPAFLAATAAAILFGKSVQSAARLESELNVFKVTAGATADEMKRAGEEAQALGRDVSLPAVSANDAAEAFTELSKAGLSVEDSFAGARGVLQLAAAAQIDNAQATELAASALNAFGLSGDQAVHVADVLANSANAAQGSITDIGIALQQASAAGRQAGLSLEQTTAILTLFARNGIKGSDAGTLLRTLLIRLINPTDKAAKVIKQLGLNIRDASGAIDVHVFQQFADATRNIAPAARDQAAAIIAGQDAFRGLSILAREGGAALDEQTAALNKTGTAAEVAGARMAGLSGQTSALRSNLETLGTTIGQGVNPFLEGLAHGLNLIVSGANVGGGAFAAFVKSLGTDGFDAANANLAELVGRLEELQGQIDDLNRSGGEGTTSGLSESAKETVAQVAAIGKALSDTPAGVQKFVNAFKQASPQIAAVMKDDVITPLEAAQLQTTALGRAFLAGVPKSARSGLGAAIRSDIEDAGARAKEAVADIGPEIASGIEDAGRQAVVAARHLGTDMGDALKTSISDAIQAGASAVGPAVSNLQLALAQASGNQGQELTVLRAQQARQQKFLDAVLGRDQTPKNVALATKAANNLKQTNDAIDRIQADQQAARDKVVSDAKQSAAEVQQKAQAAQTAQAKADQAVLDSFIPAQNRLDLAAINANATDRLSDNLKLQNAIIAEANREVKIITDTVQGVKAKNAALAAQAKVIAAAEAERDRIIGQIATTATENRRKAADALTEALGKQITLAELRENDQAQIAALNKAIANAKARIRNYKKLGLNLLDEKIALEQLINDRDEVRDTANDAAKATGSATTAFDLLKEAADTFDKSAGNLINGNQPFAGPTGFTADIAQFLIRRQQPTAAAAPPRGTVQVPPVQLQDQPLIQAIEKLTGAILGASGNASTAGGTPSARASRQWHSENQMARQFQEG